MMKHLLILLVLGVVCKYTNAQPAAQGQWQNMTFNYYTTQLIDNNKTIEVATRSSCYTYDKNNRSSISFNKTDGLSDWRVRCIGYAPDLKIKIIAYENSKIDIINEQNDVLNVYDLFQKSLPVSKKINKIKVYKNTVYFCTDFGIVTYDLSKQEFKETYVIGPNAAYLQINDVMYHQTKLYAATASGLYEADSTANLNDYNNWQLNSVVSTAVKLLSAHGNQLNIATDHAIYQYNNPNWVQRFNYNQNVITSMRSYASKHLVTVWLYDNAGEYSGTQLLELHINGTIDTIPTTGYKHFDALIDSNNDYYLANASGLYIKKSGTANWEYNFINSMPTETSYNMKYDADKMWMLPAMPSANNYSLFGFHAYDDYNWQSYDQYRYPGLARAYAIHDLSIDKTDGSVFAASFRSGLIHLKNNVATLYDTTNSPIKKSKFDPAILIGGVAHDADNNLWLTNFGTDKALIARKPDGSWLSFLPDINLPNTPLQQILIDSYNSIWIRALGDNGSLVFNYNGTIDDTSDDYWVNINSSSGLPGRYINTFVEDKSKEVWVACNEGIGVFRCINDVFVSCKAEQIRTTLGGFGSYLFEGVNIVDIAVDGGNRKWIATSAGVYLLSPDGQEQLLFFDENNSPLLSNTVLNININEKTGEVFFIHDNGISTYRSNASTGSETQAEAYVYPNPARLNLNPLISITQLADNSEVKITDVAGNLVYQSISNGGTLVWNGKDYLNNTVASGVYFAMVNEATTKQKRTIAFTLINE